MSKEEKLKEELADYYALPDNLRKLYDEYMHARYGKKVSTFVKNSFAKALSNYVNGVDRDGYGSKPYSERELKRLKRLGFNLNPETVEDVAKLFDKDPGLYLDDYPMEGMEDLIRDLVPELKDKSDEEVLEWYNNEEETRKPFMEQYEDLTWDELNEAFGHLIEARKVTEVDGKTKYSEYKYKGKPIIHLTDEEIAEKYPDTIENAIKARDKARATAKEYSKKSIKIYIWDMLHYPSKEVLDDFMYNYTGDIHNFFDDKFFTDYLNGPFLDKFIPTELKEALSDNFDTVPHPGVDRTLGEAALDVLNFQDNYEKDIPDPSLLYTFVKNNPDSIGRNMPEAWINSPEYGTSHLIDKYDSDSVKYQLFEKLADEEGLDVGEDTIAEATRVIPEDALSKKNYLTRSEAVQRLLDIHNNHIRDKNFDDIINQLKLLREGKDSKESLMEYLDEHYPEETPAKDPAKESRIVTGLPKGMLGKKKEVEKVIEENPKEAEVALESMGQDELAEEAKQVQSPDKRDDEVNDKVVEEAVKPEALSEGYEDGMRKRTEEQQAEFDRIKAESDKAAEEWRKQQADRSMDNRAQEAANPSTNPSATSGQSDSGEQRPEISIDDVNEEMKRFSGSKKRKGKGSIDELEALEFNPEEFNKQYEKQYGNKKPEEAIKEELSEDEKNDMEYKPSEEELKALHDANKAEWEANGRPKKKDVLDQDIKIDPDLMQKMVDDQLKEETEKAIEEDPERAEEAAEKSLGEGNPIEEEAEQANDQSNKRDDEVNDDSLNNLEDDMAFLDEYNGEGAEFDANDDPNSLLSRNQRYAQELNAPERPLDSVVDYGLEDRNVYPDKPHDWSKRQKMVNEKYNEDFEPNYNPEERPDFNVDDTVIDKKAKKLPDLDIEEIPQEELERIFSPLNKEIEGLNSQLKSAEDALELAQRHFDENPDEKNAAALNAANQKYQDVQYILNKRQGEYAEAYENMANLYQPKVEEEEPYFIKEVEEEPEEERTPFNMKGTNINFGGSATVTPNTPHMEERRGGSGGIGSKMVPMHALGSGSVTPGSVGGGINVTPEPKQMQQGRSGSASITPPANQSAPRGFGSSNDAPHSNGTTSSGAVNYTPKSTNYTSPTQTAPKLAMLGHTSQSGMAGGEVPSLGLLGRNSNPKELLIAQLEAALNQLSMKNPELVAKLGFGHKYKHWDYNNITLEELSPNDLNDLLKKVQSLN